MVDKSANATSSSPSPDWLKRNGWNLGVAVTVVLALGAGFRFVGQLDERVNANRENFARLHDSLTILEQKLDDKVAEMDQRLRSQITEIEAVRDQALEEIDASIRPQDDPVIFVNGALTSGLDMGISSSSGRTNWVEFENSAMCMEYPPDEQWGAVFITVGEPTQFQRPGRDFSMYRKLLIEAKSGSGDQTVYIGVKDNTDRDDGSETLVKLNELSSNWQNFELNLSQFITAEFARLYVVVEFVFQGGDYSNVCVRRIEYLP